MYYIILPVLRGVLQKTWVLVQGQGGLLLSTGNREPLTLQKKMSCMLSPRWSATGALTVPGLPLMFMLLMMSFPFT